MNERADATVRRFGALVGLALLAGGCIPGIVFEDSTTDGGSSTGAATTTDTPTTGAPTTGAPGDGTCDFAGDVQTIFTARCAGCHAGQTAPEGLELAEGAAHAALVGVESAQQPGTMRVAPGEPAASYLLMKVSPDPPMGSRMPVGGELSAAEIATLTAWIAAGAPESESFACAGGGESEVGEVEIDAGTLQALAVGELASLAAVVKDPEGVPVPGANARWHSSDGLTLYVDGVGGLLGVSPGSATIVAEAGGIESAPVTIEVVPATPPAASFSAIRELTLDRCAVAGCHVDGVEPGDLRFDRDPEDVWEELVEDNSTQVPAMRRIVPHAPRDSYVMHKLALDAPPVGGRMPLNQPPLAAAEVQVVLRWILAGAGAG